jgi:transcriptional regulator with PAS, ATPase and Fis domain
MDAQVKLLRVLEDRKVIRIGGKKDIPVNIRLISATNKNLFTMVQNNTFRLDLYYRLNIFVVNMPPLRERDEDIPLLVDHFIRKHNESLFTKVTGCSQEALTALCAYAWPGNIRDLENAVQSAMIVCKTGKLQSEHLPLRIDFQNNSPNNNKIQKDDNDKETILTALEHCKYSKTDTAEYLGISRKTLFNRIKKYGLE